MFSAEAGVHERTSALRNPRRRQRTSSSDSLAVTQQQTKRRRHNAPRDESHTSPEVSRYTNGSAENKPIIHLNGLGRRDSILDSNFDSASNLALRSKTGRREKRGTRNDDGVELTKTDTYVLTRDRGIPQVLQEIISSQPWNSKLCPELGYAVAFTHKRAIIWRYGHTRLGSNGDVGTYVIKLADADSPPASRQGDFATLPTGTLVHDAGAGDLALVVVLPGGKVQYFESVRAAAEGNVGRSKAQFTGPLKGSISGIYSGETITQIAEAEPDGFLLATDTGRLAHLSVRDPQGRPLITTQHLKSPNADKNGLFGSIRNALKFGGPSQDIVSINTIPSRERSHRSVLVANERGVVRTWNIARHGPKTIENEWDLKASVGDACRTVSPDIHHQESAAFLDLTLMPIRQDASSAELNTMALVSFPSTNANKLFLVGMSLQEGAINVHLVHPIRSYGGSEAAADLVGGNFKPRLCVPQAGHTAFVIAGTSILVVSLTQVEDSPSAQLTIENEDLAENYEECLFFDRKSPFHTVGCAVYPADERAEKSACDVMVHGFGHVKIFASAANAAEKRHERRQKAIKTHLEQVVFFGNTSENLLDFGHDAIWHDVTDEEIDNASAEILQSILYSNSPHIPSLSLSMDLQLKNRIHAVQELNKFSRRWNIPIASRWSLLWAAEKLVAARAVFAKYNESLSGRQPEQRRLLEEICDMVANDGDPNKDQPNGETDRVRSFFTYNIANFGELVPWAQQAVDELYEEGVSNIEEQAPLVSQAGDMIITALDQALEYREQNAESFGLGKDTVIQLVYSGDYNQMDQEPWTCNGKILERTRLMIRLMTESADRLDKLDMSELGMDEELLQKLATDAPLLVNATFRAWEEHCRWLESQTGKMSRESVRARSDYDAIRNESLCALSDIALQVPATELAEKYHDMDALAMVTSSIRAQGQMLIRDPSPEERAMGESYLEEVETKEDGYFNYYGDGWAKAYFQRQISEGNSAGMLVQPPKRQRFATQYLRKLKEDHPRAYKISWINEARGEKSFDQAADDLMQAQNHEKRLWAKEVELSLAKLMKLAAVERKQTDAEVVARDVKKIDQRIQISQKQKELCEFMRPELVEAIDDSAALGLVNTVFCRVVEGKETLKNDLLQTLLLVFRRQVLDIEPLIDTLSLISSGGDKILDHTFADERFYNALWLLYSSGLDRMDPFRAELTEKCIWRRCIIIDGWESFSNTEGRSDEAMVDEFRNTMVYKTLRKGFESELFNAHPPPDPRTLHSVGETVADLRKSSRYNETSSDSYLSNLAADHSIEGDALRTALSQGRLEMRWQNLIEIVKHDLRGDQDQAGQLMAFQESERQVVEKMLDRDQPIEHPIVISDHEESQEQSQPKSTSHSTQNGTTESFESVNGNGTSVEPKQTTPKKSKKKGASGTKKASKGSKKKEEVEKENKKDEQGDIQMFG